MRQESEPVSEPGVLTPSIPWDVGARSQRQRIFGAMARSCAEKTFSATTIADIVGYANISRATFYKHFANKQECFDAAAEDFLAELQSAAADAHSSEDSQAEAIRNVTRVVLACLAAKPAYASLLLVDAPSVDPEIVRRYRDLVMRSLDTQLRTVKEVTRAGADPEIAFGRAKVLVADYLAAGQVKELPSLLPELVYVALLPYVGHEEALAEADLSR